MIVIALLGVIAVVVLSAIDPLEQAKKARDAARKQDAAELLNAYERYYTTFGCYPWDSGCAGTSLSGTINPDFGSGGNSAELLNRNELKTQFTNRKSVTDGELWVSENASTNLVSVCFEPESKNFRTSGGGPTKNITNSSDATCTGNYSGGGQTATCFICVPQ